VNVERKRLRKYKPNSSLSDFPFSPQAKSTDLTEPSRKMSKSAESDEEDKPKKAKRTGPSLLQLEREKYLKAGAASSAASKVSRGKRKAGDDDEDVLSALDGFRKKLDQASKKAVPEPKVDEEEKREKLHGIDLNDDELEDDDVSSQIY